MRVKSLLASVLATIVVVGGVPGSALAGAD